MVRQSGSDPQLNIQFLLENWQYLFLSCTDAITSYKDLSTAEMALMGRYPKLNYNIEVRSLTEQRQKTLVFLSHANHQLKCWEKSCANDPMGRLRRYIIREHYRKKPHKTLKEIAIQRKKPIFVISQQRDIALHQLSAMIFGADGLLNFGAVYNGILEEISSQRSGGSQQTANQKGVTI